MLALCDPPQSELHLWVLGADAAGLSMKLCAAPLPQPGRHAVHVVDNLLVVHNVTAGQSLLLEVPLPPSPAAAPPGLLMSDRLCPADPPPGPPLPAALRCDARREWYAAEGLAYELPNLVLDAPNGRVCALALDLEAVLRGHPRRDSPRAVAALLLRRRGGAPLLLRQLGGWLRRRVPVPVLGDVFDLMNGACAQFRRVCVPGGPGGAIRTLTLFFFTMASTL